MADLDLTKPRAQRSKLSLTMLGNPQLVKTMTPDELAKSKGKYLVGTIYGAASDLVQRSSPDGSDKFEGLRGSFIGVPSDSARLDEIESGVLFIPDAFHTLVADKLREVKKHSETGTVEFAFECYAVPAKNPAGYSWELTPAMQFEGKHPLENLVSRVKQLTDQRAPQRAIAGSKK